jgi:hypothetical protein
MVRNLSGSEVEVAVLIYGIDLLIASILLSFLLVYTRATAGSPGMTWRTSS